MGVDKSVGEYPNTYLLYLFVVFIYMFTIGVRGEFTFVHMHPQDRFAFQLCDGWGYQRQIPSL